MPTPFRVTGAQNGMSEFLTVCRFLSLLLICIWYLLSANPHSSPLFWPYYIYSYKKNLLLFGESMRRFWRLALDVWDYGEWIDLNRLCLSSVGTVPTTGSWYCTSERSCMICWICSSQMSLLCFLPCFSPALLKHGRARCACRIWFHMQMCFIDQTLVLQQAYEDSTLVLDLLVALHICFMSISSYEACFFLKGKAYILRRFRIYC